MNGAHYRCVNEACPRVGIVDDGGFEDTPPDTVVLCGECGEPNERLELER